MTERAAGKTSQPFAPGKLSDAFRFAAEMHGAQTRKGSDVPYITHLMAVAALVGENGGDTDLMIAALLHDCIEDTAADYEQVLQRFGRRVADIVRACSDAETQPKPPWRERKEKYIAHLQSASADVKLVSAADKLHNARCTLADLKKTGPAAFDKFNAPADDILWYYRGLIASFRKGWNHALVDALERTVDAIEASLI